MLALSDTGTLTVPGDAGDWVSFADTNWSYAGTSGGFAAFTNGAATVRVPGAVSVDASLAIAPLDANKPEGNAGSTPFVFAVTRSWLATGVTSVAWQVIGNGPFEPNAADFVDGVVPSGTLTFAPGETSKLISIGIAGDTAVEAYERFRVVLSAPDGGAVITTASAKGTILNDDTNIAVASSTGNHTEGNAGSTPFVFTLSRTGVLSGTNTVAWVTAGAGATPVNAADFAGGVAPSGTVTFNPGHATRTVTVDLAGDLLLEPDEFFKPVLLAPTGGATVTRGGNVAGTHTVHWAVSGVAPNSVGPLDFVSGSALSGDLTFIRGKTTQ